MENLFANINEAFSFIREKTDSVPSIGIILGTGLGDLVNQIEIETTIDYSSIPHFPLSTVESHTGKLIFGSLSDKKIVAMQGRFHFYEGYSMHEITFPVRVFEKLGVKTLIISNACGSMNPLFKKANLMVIDDHINLLGDNPLIALGAEFGNRFVDMSEPYNQQYIKLIESIAIENKVNLYKGVYVAMSGPSLETRAEYRFLRAIGADVVGMSTVPETIVALQCRMKVLGLAILTDECLPDKLEKCKIEDIIETANSAEPNLTLLVKEFIKQVELP